LGQPALEQQMASINLISPEYFAALRIPLLEGRIWNETENHNGAHLMVINRTLAQRYFPKGDAIGHSVKLPAFEDRPPTILSAAKIADSWLQIVCIVGDARNDGLVNPIQPAVFMPYTLNMGRGTQILVRTEAPQLTLLHAVRMQLTAVDSEQQSYSTTEDLDSWISDEPEWQQEHLAAWIFGVFGGLALALAQSGFSAWSPTQSRSGPMSSAFAWPWVPSAATYCGSFPPRLWGAWGAASRSVCRSHWA
jgi:hypothetical protein